MNLHLGCGNRIFEGWVNIDLDSPTADHRMDLRDPLPYDDASVQFIYNEHFIEHVTRAEALAFLKECRRVLRPDGVLRLSTPDLRYAAISYLSGNIYEWGELFQPGTAARLLNEALRSWGHQFVYDKPELCLLFEEAGFGAPSFKQWGKSDYPELQNRETRPFHRELIVEAGRGELRNVIGRAPDEVEWPALVNSKLAEQIEELKAAHAAEIEKMKSAYDAETKRLGDHIKDLNNHISGVEAELASRSVENDARGEQIVRLEQQLRQLLVEKDGKAH